MPLHRWNHEEAEEGYFASVSDLMVGILFVFLLMLTVFAINYRQAEQDQMVRLKVLQQRERELEQQKRETAIQKAEAARQRDEARRQEVKNATLKGLLRQAVVQLESEIESREAARRTLLTTMRDQLSTRGIQVVIDQRSGVLRLSGDLLFASGSAALSGDALRTVRALAEVMATAMPCYAADAAGCGPDARPVLEAVLIEGHTDHRPFADTARYRDNDQLATERALAVFAELRRAQPELDVLRNTDGLQLLGAAGYGDRRPLPDAQGTSEDDFRKNRRIDIRFVLTSRASEELQRLRDQIRRAIEFGMTGQALEALQRLEAAVAALPRRAKLPAEAASARMLRDIGATEAAPAPPAGAFLEELRARLRRGSTQPKDLRLAPWVLWDGNPPAIGFPGLLERVVTRAEERRATLRNLIEAWLRDFAPDRPGIGETGEAIRRLLASSAHDRLDLWRAAEARFGMFDAGTGPAATAAELFAGERSVVRSWNQSA